MKKYLVTSTNFIEGNEEGNINLLANTIVGTYDEIKALRDNGKLTPNTRYIINDYKTEYYILGSNSSGIIRSGKITALISDWAVINDDYVSDMPDGTVVTISKLPEGYTGGITVGSTTTVTSSSSNYYFRFANGMQGLIGIEFNYYITRYQGITQDAIILDNNNKNVMKPLGIINTEVHDGTPYMDQTALQNLTVPTERIVLLSATNNSFSTEAYSDTFMGDKIWYNMNNTDIKNDNNQIIGTRKGLIYKRFNEELSIDLDSDWRVCRYRRWLLNPSSITKLLNKDLDLATTKVAYQSIPLYTSKNRTNTDVNQFYIAWKPEGSMSNINSNAMRVDFAYTTVSSISAKDFNIVPLTAEYNPINVTSLILKSSYNSVFLGMSGEFNFNLDINTDSNSIHESTFVSNGDFRGSHSEIYACTFLDTFTVGLYASEVINSNFLSFSSIKLVDASLFRTIFGTNVGLISGNNNPQPSVSWNTLDLMNSDILDTVIGQSTSYLKIHDSRIVMSHMYLHYSPSSSGEDSIYMREVININGCLFSKVGLVIPRNMDKISFSDILFRNINPLRTDGYFFYNALAGATIFSKNIKLNDTNYKLYYDTIDNSDVLTRTTLSLVEPQPTTTTTTTTSTTTSAPTTTSTTTLAPTTTSTTTLAPTTTTSTTTSAPTTTSTTTSAPTL